MYVLDMFAEGTRRTQDDARRHIMPFVQVLTGQVASAAPLELHNQLNLPDARLRTLRAPATEVRTAYTMLEASYWTFSVACSGLHDGTSYK